MPSMETRPTVRRTAGGGDAGAVGDFPPLHAASSNAHSAAAAGLVPSLGFDRAAGWRWINGMDIPEARPQRNRIRARRHNRPRPCLYVTAKESLAAMPTAAGEHQMRQDVAQSASGRGQSWAGRLAMSGGPPVHSADALRAPAPPRGRGGGGPRDGLHARL